MQPLFLCVVDFLKKQRMILNSFLDAMRFDADVPLRGGGAAVLT